jgi:hypothetical protein
LKDLKCGAGAEWRRSAGPIVWKMKKYYKELRRERASCVKQNEGRLTGLVTSCIGTANAQRFFSSSYICCLLCPV